VPTGIILLDKPQGLSSNGALQKVRKAFRAKSAGHVGTLDPMATGMLPLCLDEATKVIAEIESGAKAYEFTIQLGLRTDTGDAEGQVVEQLDIPSIDADWIERVLAGFRGVSQQVPPMYSALKRDGKPLYELARQGVEVERSARPIEVRRLDLLGQRADALDLVCECGKGTYIRVLGEDIARALRTCGHLTRLRRTWAEPFRNFPMHTLEQVIDAAHAEGADILQKPDIALQRLSRAELDAATVVQLRHGKVVNSGQATLEAGERVRLYGPDREFLGLAEVLPGGRLQPRRLLLPDAR
jgi:tRNA pseudouridine55 synthase